jgi:hypothetical protein
VPFGRTGMEGELHKMLLISGLLAVSSPAARAEDVLVMDPQQALNSAEFKAGLGNDVAFYFIGAPTPGVKETNCRRVLVAAFRDFQARARK